MRFLGLLMAAAFFSFPSVAHAEMSADAARFIVLEQVPGEVTDLSVYEKDKVKIYDFTVKPKKKSGGWFDKNKDDADSTDTIHLGVNAITGEFLDPDALLEATTEKMIDITEAKSKAVDYIKSLSKGRSSPVALGYRYKSVKGQKLYMIDVTDKGRTYEVRVNSDTGSIDGMEEHT